jgi:murein DD-endopeptidase MepM/ murein hydrolase activator NlpD
MLLRLLGYLLLLTVVALPSQARAADRSALPFRLAETIVATALAEAAAGEAGPIVTNRAMERAAAKLSSLLDEPAVQQSVAGIEAQLALASIEETLFDQGEAHEPRPPATRTLSRGGPVLVERRVVYQRARAIVARELVHAPREGGRGGAAPRRGGKERWADPIRDARLTSRFGPRIDPITGQRGRMHRGVDYAAPTGTPVLATASGTVVLAGWCSRGTGNCVVIDHGDGWKSQYFHLSRVDVATGAQVGQGQRVGGLGSTGRSTGPHLHFQIGRGREAFDPMRHLGKPVGDD